MINMGLIRNLCSRESLNSQAGTAICIVTCRGIMLEILSFLREEDIEQIDWTDSSSKAELSALVP